MIDPLLLSAFFMGLAGSGHCVAMCGGVASSLQLAVKNKQDARSYTLLYNLGRLLSYSLAGALVAGISATFASQSILISQILAFISAFFMILVGLYVMRVMATLNWLESIGKIAIWQFVVKLNRYVMPLDSKLKALGYGALWGWLPCGLVYSALTWAITTGTAAKGAAFMACFALGTAPAMLALGLTTQSITKWLNNQVVRLIMGNFLVFYGLYLLTIAVRNSLH
ncbi:sulfite exporter TauE/SafE family protein [Pseudoalteromonas tunicata]|uniref:sulfite exporter TauE/SafE family protein n=1 Tax=Pseudoalteromonas tunicata TaxID=314281 RepID=UPI0027400F12|nr:sulfite exporter TauE/SafE family protein [Pseudoalteromonas tunicata]MDP4983354.1 sulfite exporter TauE/SafE family protein [Pseudoalteromonas tunicata]MDP5214058.1 sulfite exporter TauE/SafE family protein [Pseudoalteromonas tunicata]